MLNLLRRREYSVAELRLRLVSRDGHSTNAFDKALAAVQQQGLQSDERFARNWVRYRSSRGQGPLKIRAELRQRGVDGITAAAAIAVEAPDWDDLVEQLCRKRTVSDAASRARLQRFLRQRGFTGEQVRRGLSVVSDGG